jgi:hypothetical protein
MYAFKGADSIDEAVGQFYENPNKYSNSPVDHKSKSLNDAKDSKSQTYDPPPYAPPKTLRPTQHRPHTNAVIEAGLVRARDEVGFPQALKPINI